MKNFQVIDGDTGEVVSEHKNKRKAIMSANDSISKEDLLNKDQDLLPFLYSQMKQRGEIDRFGMIKVDGIYISDKFFEIASKSDILASNICKLKSNLSIRGFLKKTKTTDCKTWKDVYSVLGVNLTNKRKMASLKKVLLENDLIRVKEKLNGNKVFVVNPNLLRHGTHTSDFCIATFKEQTLTKINRYNTYLMYLNGFIEYEDLH